MLDRDKCREIREALTTHFADFDFEGINVEILPGSYRGNNVTYKLSCTLPGEDGETLSKSGEDFKRCCHRYGMTPEDLGQEFSHNGDTLKITGCRPRASKNTLLVENVVTSKVYCISHNTVKMCLKMKDTA